MTKKAASKRRPGKHKAAVAGRRTAKRSNSAPIDQAAPPQSETSAGAEERETPHGQKTTRQEIYARARRSPRKSEWSKTYDDELLARIAGAVGCSVNKVRGFGSQLDAAAGWYFLEPGRPIPEKIALKLPPDSTRNKAPIKGLAKSQVDRKLLQVVRACDRLLERMGIADRNSHKDGPADATVWNRLNQTGLSDALLSCLCSDVSRLADHVEANIGSPPPSYIHQRTAERTDIQEWVNHVLPVAEELIGRPANASGGIPGGRHDGKASGQFIDFLLVASEPLGLSHLQPDAWDYYIECHKSRVC